MATDVAASSRPRRLEVILTNRVARTTVRATDQHGAPIAGYGVIGMPAETDRWKQDVFLSMPAASADGVLKLPALLPGSYLVSALTAEDWLAAIRDPRLARLDDIRRTATKVTLAAGDNGVIELKLTPLPDKQ